MNLDTLINSNAVVCSTDISSKKRALELLSEELARQINEQHLHQPEDEEVNSLDIFQLLTDREKLGSTSLGHGVALPHARTGLTEQAVGTFLKLDNGVDFDSPDTQATDLIFALLVPEHYTDEHLKILAHLASLFSNEGFCRRLREAKNTQTLYNQLVDREPASKAS
jgi:nitrogen PTS system EIIA component